MNSVGESFRLLRKERGYTLKTMSEGIVSFSYLSKFEKGKSDITLSTFVRLLRKLNMSVDEFLFFDNQVLTDYNKVFKKMSIAYSKKDKSGLVSLYEKEMALYHETNNTYHRCNAIVISAIISDIDTNYTITKANQNFLIDYLIGCSYWTHYEVSLFGNAMTIFPDKSLMILLKEIENRAHKQKVTRRNMRDIIALLENACVILLRRNKLEEAKLVSNYLDSIIEPHYFFEKTRKLFIDGVILILEGEKNSGIIQAQKAIEIIEQMDEQLSTYHKSELEKYI